MEVATTITKIFKRRVEDIDYVLDIPHCMTKGESIGCPCNHETVCNGDGAAREFNHEDMYEIKTTGFPSWCPLENKND